MRIFFPFCHSSLARPPLFRRLRPTAQIVAIPAADCEAPPRSGDGHSRRDDVSAIYQTRPVPNPTGPRADDAQSRKDTRTVGTAAEAKEGRQGSPPYVACCTTLSSSRRLVGQRSGRSTSHARRGDVIKGLGRGIPG